MSFYLPLNICTVVKKMFFRPLILIAADVKNCHTLFFCSFFPLDCQLQGLLCPSDDCKKVKKYRTARIVHTLTLFIDSALLFTFVDENRLHVSPAPPRWSWVLADDENFNPECFELLHQLLSFWSSFFNSTPDAMFECGKQKARETSPAMNVDIKNLSFPSRFIVPWIIATDAISGYEIIFVTSIPDILCDTHWNKF